MLDIKSKGMDEVAGRMELLRQLGATVKGVALKGAMRKGGETTASIIEHLAEADTPRDIRPTEDDSDEAAAAYLAVVEKTLMMMKSKGWVTTKAGQQRVVMAARVEAKKKAEQAGAMGLRKAGKIVQAAMLQRAENNATNDGGSAEPVTPAYAAWREARHAVPPSEVYKATGQLVSELNGPIVLHYDPDMAKELKSLGLF